MKANNHTQNRMLGIHERNCTAVRAVVVIISYGIVYAIH